MNMITPEREAQRAQIAQDLKRFLKAGGKIQKCTSADNRYCEHYQAVGETKLVRKDRPVDQFVIYRGTKYPWHSIEVGQSFYVHGKEAHYMSVQAEGVRRRNAKVYEVITEPGGCRVTRVK